MSVQQNLGDKKSDYAVTTNRLSSATQTEEFRGAKNGNLFN
jgi:hypothetical protein